MVECSKCNIELSYCLILRQITWAGIMLTALLVRDFWWVKCCPLYNFKVRRINDSTKFPVAFTKCLLKKLCLVGGFLTTSGRSFQSTQAFARKLVTRLRLAPCDLHVDTPLLEGEGDR